MQGKGERKPTTSQVLHSNSKHLQGNVPGEKKNQNTFGKMRKTGWRDEKAAAVGDQYERTQSAAEGSTGFSLGFLTDLLGDFGFEEKPLMFFGGIALVLFGGYYLTKRA
jgi:hypothetical protein